MPAGHRLPAHRHREGVRGQDLPAGGHSHRPRGLPGAAFHEPGLLPGRRKTAGHGDPAAGAMDARHAHGIDASQQPPGLAGHPRHGYRGHERVPLLLPRARGHPAHLRNVLRPADDDQLFSHWRPGARAAARLATTDQDLYRRVPVQGGRVRGPADQQPHLDRPDARRGLFPARRYARSGRHRADAARRRIEDRHAQGRAVQQLREIRFRDPHAHGKRRLRALPGTRGRDAAEYPHRPAGYGRHALGRLEGG